MGLLNRDLDPALVKKILALQSGAPTGSTPPGIQNWDGNADTGGYGLTNYQTGRNTGGESGDFVFEQGGQRLIGKDNGDDTIDVFDENGKFIETQKKEGEFEGIGKFAVGAGAMYLGGSALNGGLLGFGGGAGVGAGGAGLTAGGVESVALPSAGTMAGSLPEIAVGGAGTGGTAAASGGGLLSAASGGGLNLAAPVVESVALPSAASMTSALPTVGTAAGNSVLSSGIKWATDNLLTPLGLTGKDALTLVGAGLSNVNANKNAQAARDAQIAENQKDRDFKTATTEAGWAHDAQLQADKFKRMTPTGGILAPYLQRNP